MENLTGDAKYDEIVRRVKEVADYAIETVGSQPRNLDGTFARAGKRK